MRKNYFSIVVLLVSAVFLVTIAILTNFYTYQDHSGYIPLDSHWDIMINDTSLNDVNLNSLSFPPTNRGDHLTLQTILPQEKISEPALMFYSTHSVVNMYIEDQLIYSYGEELAQKNLLLGYGYQTIELPVDCSGKELTIDLRVTENNSFSGITVPRLGNAIHLMKDYLRTNRIPLIICLFLMTIGACVTTITLFFLFQNHRLVKLWSMGVFALSVGGWSLCSYSLQYILFENFQLKSFLEFDFLYLAPLGILGYFYENFYCKNKLRKTIYCILFCSQALFFITANVLQLANILHFPALLILQHIIITCIIIYLIAIFLDDIYHKRLYSPVLLVGIFIMIFFSIFDLLRFNIEKFIKVVPGKYYTCLFCVGTMLFVISMFLDFCNDLKERLYEAATLETFQKLAYTDALTGLANRRKCEEYFDEIDQSPTNYAVLTFDLNDLKKVNDKLGHDQGDDYIKSFGNILKSTFNKSALVARTGGDEFVVIIKDAASVNISELLQTMESRMQMINAQHSDWNMSTAYGISLYQQDKTFTAKYALKIADERMYENKAKMKEDKKNIK